MTWHAQHAQLFRSESDLGVWSSARQASVPYITEYTVSQPPAYGTRHRDPSRPPSITQGPLEEPERSSLCLGARDLYPENNSLFTHLLQRIIRLRIAGFAQTSQEETVPLQDSLDCGDDFDEGS